MESMSLSPKSKEAAFPRCCREEVWGRVLVRACEGAWGGAGAAFLEVQRRQGSVWTGCKSVTGVIIFNKDAGRTERGYS